MENILQYKSFYFIGIGGISMSSLAGLISDMGKDVWGSDSKKTRITKFLQQRKIKVYIGYNKKYLKNAEVVIYNNLIKEDNPILKLAREKGLVIFDRASFLAEVANLHKKTIAISGTHGKTTTTAMVSSILLKNGSRPSIHIGGMWEAIKGNYYLGLPNYFVTEACEYKSSFLSLHPNFTIITNIEKEHLDYFKTYKNILQTFTKLSEQTKTIILPYKFKTLSQSDKTITFGFSPLADYYAAGLKSKNGCYSFNCYKRGELLGRIKINVPGKFNVSNSLSAFALCDTLGVPAKRIFDALNNFNNVSRRFEKLYSGKRFDVLLDYAHHPTEISACLSAANEVYKDVTCVFQPHTYSRTKLLMKQFEKCFLKAKKVLLLPTYASREEYDEKGSINALFNNIKDKVQCEMAEEKNIYQKCFDLNTKCIIFVGAGDIEKVAGNFVLKLKKENKG